MSLQSINKTLVLVPIERCEAFRNTYVSPPTGTTRNTDYDDRVVFLSDTKQIWTHGYLFSLDTNGSYAGLAAGQIVPKESDYILAGSEENLSFGFRSTAGDESISDGTAKLMKICGSFDQDRGTGALFSDFKSIGFNAFKSTNIIANAAINNNGEIVADNDHVVAFVHVLKGVSGPGENNGYVINRSEEYSSLAIDKVGFCTSTPAIGSTVEILEKTNSYKSQSYLPPEIGYLAIQTTSIEGLCVHLAWSGYRDNDYEEYCEKVISLDGLAEFTPDGTIGFGAADDAYNEANFETNEYIKRVEYIWINNTLSSRTWTYTNVTIDNVTYRKWKTELTGSKAPGVDGSSVNVGIPLRDLYVNPVNGKPLAYIEGNYLCITTKNDINITGNYYGKLAFYKLQTPIVDDLQNHIWMGEEVESEYRVSDFGTEEFTQCTIQPEHIVIKYEPNLVDSLRFLIERAVTSVDSELSTESENPVQNAVVTTELNKKANMDGIYKDLVAGNLLAKDTDAVIDESSFIFRTTGGNESVSDGVSRFSIVKGNVDSTTDIAFTSRVFKSIGFNAFNPTNILRGYKLVKTNNSTGQIVVDETGVLAIVHVLRTETGVGKNNGYDITFGPTYAGECGNVSDLTNRIGWMANKPTGAVSGVTLISKSSRSNSNSYGAPNDGYFIINTNGVDLNKICMHICWSGYRDNDFEEYMESTIELPITDVHDWGLGKAGDIYDDISLSEGIAHKRIGRYTLSDCIWSESTSQVVVDNPDYDPEDPSSEPMITVTYYTYETVTISQAGAPIKNGTQNIVINNIPSFDFGEGTLEPARVSVSTVGSSGLCALDICTGITQTNIKTDQEWEGIQVYYEMKNPEEIEIQISPEYRISDFGTEEFMSFIESPVPCSSASFLYLPNLLDSLRNIITKDISENVRNVYVYELDLTKIAINVTIDGNAEQLTYISGNDETVNNVLYGKFQTANSAYYYVPLAVARLSTTRKVYTRSESESVVTMTEKCSYTANNVVPKQVNPTFAANETYQNTQFHLFDNSTDRYYCWEPNIQQYVQLTTHIQANKFYIWKTAFVTGQVLYVTFDNVEDATMYNEYMLQFPTGATIPTLSFPNTIKWNLAPDLDINVTYQVSVVNNIGLIAGGLE